MDASVEAQIEAYIDGEMEELPLAKRENIGRTVDFQREETVILAI